MRPSALAGQATDDELTALEQVPDGAVDVRAVGSAAGIVDAPRFVMPNQIQDIMTMQVQCVRSDTTLLEVARMMRDRDIGDVLVTNDAGKLCGIVTDRDIVVRADALGKPLDRTRAGEICTDQLVELAPTSTIDEAVKLMRKHSIRRMPVVSEGTPVGIVTIGDLSRHQDPRSALAQISAAPANN
jgi:CBS domain-containing protein